MNKPLSCGASDMLEAAIIQKRRLNIVCQTQADGAESYQRVLPIDIETQSGKERLTFMAADNDGGIIKRSIDTADIISFEAIDFNDPRIQYHAK